MEFAARALRNLSFAVYDDLAATIPRGHIRDILIYAIVYSMIGMLV